MKATKTSMGAMETVIEIESDAPGQWSAGTMARVAADGHGLKVTFPDGHRSSWTWGDLKIMCICAECVPARDPATG